MNNLSYVLKSIKTLAKNRDEARASCKEARQVAREFFEDVYTDIEHNWSNCIAQGFKKEQIAKYPWLDEEDKTTGDKTTGDETQ